MSEGKVGLQESVGVFVPEDLSLHSIERLRASNDSGTLLKALVEPTNNRIELTISFGEFRVPLVCQRFHCLVMRKFGFSDQVCQYQSVAFFASLNLPASGCW